MSLPQLRSFAAVLLGCVLPLAMAAAAHAGALGSKYQASGQCGGFPRAPLLTPAWACAGIVAGPAQGLIMPRGIVAAGERRFIVTDMGAWSPGRGRVLQLDIGEKGTTQVKVLFDQLDLAHGLAAGPDGKIYIGERSSVWRFDPNAEVATKETVVDGLPSQGLHRLKHIVFDRNGDLLISIGAETDRCGSKGQDFTFPCREETGRLSKAALWRLRAGEGPAKERLEVVARGLRNSLALAVHPTSGLILQGENAADYPDETFPPEELNVIESGKHYGWPYCAGGGRVVPEYKRKLRDCRRYASPAGLLPAHSSPLGLLYYTGAMFPELQGRIIVSLHGYRSKGHRLVAVVADSTGRPVVGQGLKVKLTDIVDGWGGQKSFAPRGSPVGVHQAPDGSLWFVEDKNRTVMVLLRAKAGDRQERPQERLAPAPEAQTVRAPAGWGTLHADIVRPICGGCHKDLGAPDAQQAWNEAASHGWLDEDDLSASSLFQAMLGTGAVRPMPPDGLSQRSKESIEAFLSGAKAATGRTEPRQ